MSILKIIQIIAGILLLLIIYLYACYIYYPKQTYNSPNFKNGKFQNIKPIPNTVKWYKIPQMIYKHTLKEKPTNIVPKISIQSEKITNDILQKANNNTIFRLGHSTVLMKLDNNFYLTDPVFSDRASPVQWAGPKRFSTLPINISELPPIKGIILSHNHYDHLDKNAVLELNSKTEHFYTPLGVGKILEYWGIDKEKITELDWWQTKTMGNMQFTLTPTQHFSGRGTFDRNQTLWGSWAIKSSDINIFFSGDGGYSDSFKEIGNKYGPFDAVLMEVGAYNVNWPYMHMQPEESLQSFIDVKGKLLIPIHNSTFSLSTHTWQEPLARIYKLAHDKNFNIATPKLGAGIKIQDFVNSNDKNWWE